MIELEDEGVLLLYLLGVGVVGGPGLTEHPVDRRWSRCVDGGGGEVRGESRELGEEGGTQQLVVGKRGG